jgi:peptidyl-prolyl cis-trans isomerase SurA
MKRLFALLLLAGLFGLMPALAQAQRVSDMPGASTPTNMEARIAAVVNDNVISTSDVEARIEMAFLSSGLPDTPEVRQRLLLQILRSLIDEQLELQEAKKLDITISNDDIDKAMDHIAHDNNIPGGDMKAYLAAHGVPSSALASQIRASMAWNKVIQRELRPHVDVGDDEVDAVIERTRANAGKEEFLVGEIFLAVDSPKDEEQVKQFAENLSQQLKQGGSFVAIARQFSQSASAATGGDIGWIEEGVLPPELNRALSSMQNGEISEPVRAASGYYILGLRDKRTITLGGGDAGETTVELQQAFRPFDASGSDSSGAIQKEADDIRSAITDCVDLQGHLAGQFPNWHWQDLGTVKMSTAPSWIVDKIHSLPVGKASDALLTDKGALVLFVCSRKMPEGKVDREAILNQIGTEKLELQARRLLRDLRREAYLDIRLASTH